MTMTTNVPDLMCPSAHTPLRRYTGAALSKVNQLVRKKRLVNHSGEMTKGPLSALWMCSNRDAFYVERHNVPILLVKECVDIGDINDREIRAELVQEIGIWNPPSRP